MAPTTFAVVGSGRRCRFFLRIAAATPDRLRAVAIVGRRPERAHAISLAIGESARTGRYVRVAKEVWS